MEVYLVGGAVRDELLGIPVKERDWCVVGATPGELEAEGYRPVGKDFPVLIKKAHEELELSENFEMQDLQNCFCEFDKYMRILNGTGRSKRSYNGV